MAPKERQNSRVVEVVDTFVDRPAATDGQQPPLGKRYGGRVTLEEVLDSIFQSTQYIPDLPPADPRHFS
ncbi:unnamed protein product [Meloidogyne enterolobii]|uniref:Uncharacterized protein n=1 Tax=Meloidogyne enterolobii TaxID=390850 RepID=A0ACB1AA33_MELEN